MPLIRGRLKIAQIGLQIKSAHSLISLADILSRPVSLFKSETDT